MSSVHEACGENITWVRREDDTDRWLPPLEIAGEFFVIEGTKREDKVGIEKIVYRVHRCDPDKILAWEAYREKLAAVTKQDYTPAFNYEAAREREREQLWERTLKVDCPKCKMDAGKKCASLAQRYIKTGEYVEVKNPHPERVEEAFLAEIS